MAPDLPGSDPLAGAQLSPDPLDTGPLETDPLEPGPLTLAAAEAFLSGAPGAGAALRDDLGALLDGHACARLSARFIPETGSLEMRGHVPDPQMEAPIQAALAARVGPDIPVTGALLHLPSPQCGILADIAGIGLPQSGDRPGGAEADAHGDAGLVGTRAHLRAYDYSAGDRLSLDLVAPGYDAYLHVDYFTAAGEVIHLVPNDYMPPRRLAAQERFALGRDMPGEPGLEITVGPPFGKEIAVAFSATRPLYDASRPMVEPAGPYLEFLGRRVAQLRAEDPKFRGEWVYFFISTHERTP